MTPAAHWSPQDYYRASRAARRAWQATSAQLELGLDEQRYAGAPDNAPLLVEPASVAASDPPPRGRAHSVGVEPCREPLRVTDGKRSPFAAAPACFPSWDDAGASTPTLSTSMEHGALLPQDACAVLREGA